MTGERVFEETEPFRISSLQDAVSFATYISRYGESIVSGYDVSDHISRHLQVLPHTLRR